MFSFFRSLFSGDSSPAASMFDSPSVNIDGTPMMGSVDVHGNPFGVTDSLFEGTSIHSICDDSFSQSICDNHSSMFDDTFKSCGHASFDD